jgi:hypothetical protein
MASCCLNGALVDVLWARPGDVSSNIGHGALHLRVTAYQGRYDGGRAASLALGALRQGGGSKSNKWSVYVNERLPFDKVG